MSVDPTITCDGCGREISATRAWESEAFLHLDNVWKRSGGGAIFATSGPQGIDDAKDFCNVRCLAAFVTREVLPWVSQERLQDLVRRGTKVTPSEPAATT